MREFARALRRELVWWLGGFARLLRRRPAGLLGLVGVGFLSWAIGIDLTGFWLVIGGLLGLAVWCRLWPSSFARFVAEPLRRRRIKRRVQHLWPSLMDACGLVSTDRSGGTANRQTPTLHRLRWDSDGNLTGEVALAAGQTVSDVEAAADRLRTAVDARALRVVPNERRTRCQLVWSYIDSLAGMESPGVRLDP